MQEREQLSNELREVLKQWRTAMVRIGEICNRLIELGESEFQLRSICCNEFGMTDSAFVVCRRAAAGGYGGEKETEVLLRKARPSLLKNMSTEVAQKLATGRHRIASPTQGRVVSKTLQQMDRHEVAHCVKQYGIPPIKDQIRRDPVLRSCAAFRYEVDGDDVIFVSTGSTPVHMRVSRRMLNEAAEDTRAVCTA